MSNSEHDLLQVGTVVEAAQALSHQDYTTMSEKLWHLLATTITTIGGDLASLGQ